MIELLYRRKLIRELLNQYSPKLWNQIIPLILEIGVVYLRKKFKSTGLNIQDFRNILDDMKSKDSEQAANLKIRRKENTDKSHTIDVANIYHSEPEDESRKKNRRERNFSRKKRTFVARKPSGEWRKGDEYIFRENENLQDLKNIYSSSPENKNVETSNMNINKVIYPKWWGSEEPQYNSEEEPKSKTKNQKCDFISGKAEVFMPTKTNTRSRSKSTSGMRSRQKYFTLTKEEENLMNEKIKNAESKIKSQLIYDKSMYNQSKYQQEQLSSTIPPDWKYNENTSKVKNEENRRMPTPSEHNPNMRVHYMISYDKNFKPEKMKEKSKEKTIPKNNSKRNNEHKKEDTCVDNNVRRVNDSSFKNKVSSIPENEEEHKNFTYKNQEVSFNKKEAEEELLSSYAPSERTKNFFQREFTKENNSYASSNKYNEGAMNFSGEGHSQKHSEYSQPNINNLAFSGENSQSQQNMFKNNSN